MYRIESRESHTDVWWSWPFLFFTIDTAKDSARSIRRLRIDPYSYITEFDGYKIIDDENLVVFETRFEPFSYKSIQEDHDKAVK